MADILGPDWDARVIPLPPDAEGPVVATLVHRPGPPAHRRAVLYVHGFVDYFFQTHLAREWEQRRYSFYALDLRKYGRSLLPHQTPNFCLDLAEYDGDLDAAISVLRDEFGHDVVVLMAHSTGGLIASLWANKRRKANPIDALVLNSPWFDLNGTRFERTLGTWFVNAVGAMAPRLGVSDLGDHYGRSLHVSTGGKWDYDLDLKPLNGFPVLAGWVRAIRLGHAELHRGLDIACPALVCTSTASGPNRRWHAAIDRTDSVLNVADIAAQSIKLGRIVTLVRIENGIHDLTLSSEPARSRFFSEVFRWAEAYVPGERRP
ncbi:alpha/beta hydrolase [Youhaiella tibetensis]|uniref:Alpha/beta hydrolase n=1 Tax=Paradevosia tibetensis TaxID=1447062 RepID=A0A5B9DMD4_9HYPH|nr:alpha/beta hydrolase [Youhaiella tibetensis]QEE20511.1 alpha/beta hydrolase [Youhaiella tibetensis]GGF23503.1 alpha/beta hydrolase [Youhaiella tibetensis]